MASKGEWYQGTYEVTNKEKYIGKKNPVFRSSWEKRAFWWADNNRNVIRWASEPFSIPYHIQGEKTKKGKPKIRRYFPDLYIEIKTRDGTVKKYVFEIKPKSKCKPPRKPKRKTRKSEKTYQYLIEEWVMNNAKWEAASKACDKRGIKFNIITEDDLF